MESRWAYQDDNDESDFEDEAAEGEGAPDVADMDLEDEDNVEQRLIRTGQVPGTHRNVFEEFGFVLVFQTLVAVFGDVGTSPLYAFRVMFNKAPINGKEDVLGALSLVLYTLILFPLVKYVLAVLWASAVGEGGTFSLYSLIRRHASRVSLIRNQPPSDSRISSFRLKVPFAELERSLQIKERLENSVAVKKLLLVFVLAGTSMVIADGVVTPAISETVVMIAVPFLIILFSLQKYGTTKMGFVVGPALFIRFCLLAGIGIYNLIKYDSNVWSAFNPVHIYYFFKRNTIKAWYALGGCFLAVTGSEAMFADLCYFSVRSVQLTFVCLVFPCLLLCYLGQAAYLMQNPDDSSQAFYSSIPSGAFWPVFIIANVAALITSQSMTTATFSCIKQLTARGCLPRLKIIHTSRKFMGQIYIPVLNFLLVACILLVCAVSSITEMGNAYGIAELGVMMTTAVIVTLVMLLIWQINMFRCIAKYGCNNVRKANHQTFEQLLIENLEKFIVQEAQERSLESDGDERDMDSENESLSSTYCTQSTAR